MKNLKRAISKYNLAYQIEKNYKNSTKFETKIESERLAKVLINAEKIYNHYLSQGIKIAQERKNNYIKNN